MKSLNLASMVLLLLSCPCADAQSAGVGGIQIVERGLYEAHTDTARQPRDGLWTVLQPRLITSTTTIPMRQGVRFGFRYVMPGARGDRIETVELVTRYPSPGLWDGRARDWRKESRYQVRLQTGVAYYRDFQLLEPEELLPGLWIFEFWRDGRKLGEQRFCVVAGEMVVPLSEDTLCLSSTS